MKYKSITLGCKVNQYETQALENMLNERGFVSACENEQADVVIVNTCAVTAESGRKSRQAIRKLMAGSPAAVSVVCGCFSQISSENVESLGVDIVHGSGSKARLVDDIEKVLAEKQKTVFNDNPFERYEFEELPSGAAQGRTRAMLKIQDGCVNFCTYCIIPYTRGRLRSLPPERCAASARKLAEQGYLELVVTGIEIASYGRDLSKELGLVDAVEAIAENSGDMRIRLGSLEPTVITEEFCDRLAKTGKVCNHFHLSLQSGCDEILKKMNRKYDTARFYEACQLLRKFFPHAGLTADLIVGFPGETDEQQEQCLKFIQKCGFASMHIFPYSIRPGTKAADMEGQHNGVVKAKRAAQAQKVAEEMEKTFLESCKDMVLEVLFEAAQDGLSVGHASNYAQVCVSDGQLRGLVKNVQICDKTDTMLVGKVV